MTAVIDAVGRYYNDAGSTAQGAPYDQMQAAFEAMDFEARDAALLGTGWDSGLLVTAGSGMTVHVAGGNVRVNGALLSVTGVDLTLTAADADLDRRDCIRVDAAGALYVAAGTPGAIPASAPLHRESALGHVDEVQIATIPVLAGVTAVDPNAIWHNGKPCSLTGSSGAVNLAPTAGNLSGVVRWVANCSTQSGSTTVTCTDVAFTQADVGKTVEGLTQGSLGQTYDTIPWPSEVVSVASNGKTLVMNRAATGTTGASSIQLGAFGKPFVNAPPFVVHLVNNNMTDFSARLPHLFIGHHAYVAAHQSQTPDDRTVMWIYLDHWDDWPPSTQQEGVTGPRGVMQWEGATRVGPNTWKNNNSVDAFGGPWINNSLELTSWPKSTAWPGGHIYGPSLSNIVRVPDADSTLSVGWLQGMWFNTNVGFSTGRVEVGDWTDLIMRDYIVDGIGAGTTYVERWVGMDLTPPLGGNASLLHHATVIRIGLNWTDSASDSARVVSAHITRNNDAGGNFRAFATGGSLFLDTDVGAQLVHTLPPAPNWDNRWITAVASDGSWADFSQPFEGAASDTITASLVLGTGYPTAIASTNANRRVGIMSAMEHWQAAAMRFYPWTKTLDTAPEWIVVDNKYGDLTIGTTGFAGSSLGSFINFAPTVTVEAGASPFGMASVLTHRATYQTHPLNNVDFGWAYNAADLATFISDTPGTANRVTTLDDVDIPGVGLVPGSIGYIAARTFTTANSGRLAVGTHADFYSRLSVSGHTTLNRRAALYVDDAVLNTSQGANIVNNNGIYIDVLTAGDNNFGIENHSPLLQVGTSLFWNSVGFGGGFTPGDATWTFHTSPRMNADWNQSNRFSTWNADTDHGPSALMTNSGMEVLGGIHVIDAGLGLSYIATQIGAASLDLRGASGASTSYSNLLPCVNGQTIGDIHVGGCYAAGGGPPNGDPPGWQLADVGEILMSATATFSAGNTPTQWEFWANPTNRQGVRQRVMLMVPGVYNSGTGLTSLPSIGTPGTVACDTIFANNGLINSGGTLTLTGVTVVGLSQIGLAIDGTINTMPSSNPFQIASLRSFSGFPQFALVRAIGQVNATDLPLGRFDFFGQYDATSTHVGVGAYMQGQSAGAWTASSYPTRIQIYTTPAGAIVPALVLTIGSSGTVLAESDVQTKGKFIPPNRQTYGVPTGTFTRATFNATATTTTVTLASLAQRVAALIIDLQAIGLTL